MDFPERLRLQGGNVAPPSRDFIVPVLRRMYTCYRFASASHSVHGARRAGRAKVVPPSAIFASRHTVTKESSAAHDDVETIVRRRVHPGIPRLAAVRDLKIAHQVGQA